MSTIGVLVHVYSLQLTGWDALIWGDPARDTLGVGTTLVDYLLDAQPGDNFTVIMYTGPSRRDGLGEGAAIRQLLLDRFNDLREFDRLQGKIDDLTPSGLDLLHQRLKAIVLGPDLRNTRDEIIFAARYFASLDVTNVVEIANPNHAPRCMQTQAAVREAGLIRGNQRWQLMASETAPTGYSAADTVVVEPSTRADDPLTVFKPQLSTVIKPFYGLDAASKQVFVAETYKLIKRLHGRIKN